MMRHELQMLPVEHKAKLMRAKLMIVITPEIITMCTKKLKPGKDDGDMSFKSDHLIHGGHQLHVVLSTLFNTMFMDILHPVLFKVYYFVNSKRL